MRSRRRPTATIGPMRRSKRKKTGSEVSASSRAERLRALPWLAALRASFIVGGRVSRLSERDRARLGGLLRESRGWPPRLSAKDRAELRKIIGKLDPKALGRELLPLWYVARRGGKRRR